MLCCFCLKDCLFFVICFIGKLFNTIELFMWFVLFCLNGCLLNFYGVVVVWVEWDYSIFFLFWIGLMIMIDFQNFCKKQCFVIDSRCNDIKEFLNHWQTMCLTDSSQQNLEIPAPTKNSLIHPFLTEQWLSVSN